MNNALKKFYYGFYTPLPMAEFEQEIEDCHQQLFERLEKPERKLVLRIMDAQNLITEERSMRFCPQQICTTSVQDLCISCLLFCLP